MSGPASPHEAGEVLVSSAGLGQGADRIFAGVKSAAASRPHIFSHLFSASSGSLAEHPYFSLFFYRLTPK
ncbi:MAG: hypothetical protein ACREP9_07265, partial [Candidatus Dormibacteraceae bacterium]